MSDAQVEELIPRDVRAALVRGGLLAESASADDLRQMLVRLNADFRDKAPLSAADAATIILNGVRSGGLADPRRRGRQGARRRGAREARGRLRLRRAGQVRLPARHLGLRARAEAY